jgi:hypothetical protein
MLTIIAPCRCLGGASSSSGAGHLLVLVLVHELMNWREDKEATSTSRTWPPARHWEGAQPARVKQEIIRAESEETHSDPGHHSLRATWLQHCWACCVAHAGWTALPEQSTSCFTACPESTSTGSSSTRCTSGTAPVLVEVAHPSSMPHSKAQGLIPQNRGAIREDRRLARQPACSNCTALHVASALH